jgi:hypothetical protein
MDRRLENARGNNTAWIVQLVNFAIFTPRGFSSERNIWIVLPSVGVIVRGSSGGDAVNLTY